MSFMNEATLMGNIGMKPILTIHESGKVSSTVKLATMDFWIDKQTGKKMERTTWHKIVFWNETAQAVVKHCDKGDKIWCRGEIRIKNYIDNEGVTRKDVEVNGRFIKFIRLKEWVTKAPVVDETPLTNEDHANAEQIPDDISDLVVEEAYYDDDESLL